jgi:uncharacterized damage-inducible protein DinB
MIAPGYVQRLARYNRWQNENVYGVADSLSDAERRRERGAFFGSIHKTLSHLLWADRIWMSRFTDVPSPGASIRESVSLYPDWAALRRERSAFDTVIVGWAEGLDPAWLEGDLTWFSGAAKREVTKPKWFLVTHLFNHQTHHRGQVTTLFSQLGIDVGVTDLSALIPECHDPGEAC